MHADSASSLKEQLSELLEPSCAREKKKTLELEVTLSLISYLESS